ncbi:N-acetylmuramoyl-L-alanine amidase [Sphingomonas sabuli]|uniref:N-acetylmuramoyl-L-alanine amidase n=1 Tax=Sphingomonas sabuli TaxID=2764186 RepID=A0A7G9L4X5_9SPHN|nr:N-acetylmuramoyl-L-alanine amidase [Sphingomonas sabuli]QNM83674.1 N-acetylmuramoyl-L-alanine amidase [Sphingomonas sabuli]
MNRQRLMVGGGIFAVAATALLALGTSAFAGGVGDSAPSVTVPLPSPHVGLKIIEARVPGRPLVLIDPGHGGRDPGASAVSGDVSEKALTLEFARELRDALAKRGRVRIALTREDDRYLTLEQRSALARRVGASLYVSLHMDSAPNPLARGASIYSLSDVASDAEAARLARSENRALGRSAGSDGSVRAILSDLVLRSRMSASADFAERLVRHSTGRVALRPQPHRFADFHVLRSAGVPAVLFEAGYISNVDDEALLRSPEQRARIVAALASSIEADMAARALR